jgi:hypothetical protein
MGVFVPGSCPLLHQRDLPRLRESRCQEPVQMIHMMLAVSTPPKDYAQLESAMYDPAKDPDIDMFMGSWKNSMPFNSLSLKGEGHIRAGSGLSLASVRERESGG